MASGAIVINPEHLEGGDGTMAMALQLWSCRNGPVIYNQWQSLYFALRRSGITDEAHPLGESQGDKQKRLRTSYKELHENLHGPDYLAEALLRARQTAPASQPAAALVLAEPPPTRQSLGRDAAESLLGPEDADGSVAEEFAIGTPRGGASTPAMESPDRLLYQQPVRDLMAELDPTHTEATDEMDERMRMLASRLSTMEDVDQANLEFVISVETLVRDYTQYYGNWMQEDVERAKTPLKVFAMEKLTKLRGDRFESQSDLKRHIYALGKLAERSPENSRALIKSLWNSSERPSPDDHIPDQSASPQPASPPPAPQARQAPGLSHSPLLPRSAAQATPATPATTTAADMVNVVGVVTDGFKSAMGEVVEQFKSLQAPAPDSNYRSDKLQAVSGFDLKRSPPSLRDDDPDMDRFTDAFEDAIACYQYGGRTMRDIDKLHLFGNSFPAGSTRRLVYDNFLRSKKREGRLPQDAGQVYVELIAMLKTYIWETELQKMTRIDKEFELLEQGSMSHADFRAIWDSKLQDMLDCKNMDVPTEQTLYRKYLNKMHPELRVRILSKEWKIDGPDKNARMPKTATDVAIAAGLLLEEKADIHATGTSAQDSFMYTDGAPKSKGAGKSKGGNTLHCGYCQAQDSHHSSICPQRAADSRNESAACRAAAASKGHKCTICGAEGHQQKHHLMAAQDSANNNANKGGGGKGQQQQGTRPVQPSYNNAANVPCQGCGSTAHSRKDCSHKDSICNSCGKPGHIAKVCKGAAGGGGGGGGSAQPKGGGGGGGGKNRQKGDRKGSNMCSAGLKCTNIPNWGTCTDLHPKEEWQVLIQQFRDKYPAGKGKGKGDKGKGDKGKGKGVETAHVAVESQPAAPNPNRRGLRFTPGGSADVVTTICEESYSLQEKIMHHESLVDRIRNTVELSDFLETPPVDAADAASYAVALQDPCYSLSTALTLHSDEYQHVGDENGLSSFVERLCAVNPDFAYITKLDDLEPDEFLKRKLQRPVGYASNTRLHFGRLCVPMLNDSGATCSLLTEEQVVLLLNHTSKMLDEGKITMEDYNYPIVEMYKYEQSASLRGAEKTGRMAMEYAIKCRVEFIPAGCETGPVREIYFKILKAGTCGIIGGVLGWPNLDHPSVPGGEGLGWKSHADCNEYSSLGVSIPRLDDHRKLNYHMSVGRYSASGGEFMSVTDDVTGESVRLIDAEGAQLLRAASMQCSKVPTAKMQPFGLEFVVLQPGERAVLPVLWDTACADGFECSTHPHAPDGLAVMPGACPAGSEMCIVIENESPLPITITEKDHIAVGTSPDDVPTFEACALIQARREKFHGLIDWKGGGEDTVREVPSLQPGKAIIIVVHRVPRFASCAVAELPEPWHDKIAASRVTTLTYEAGDVDYLPEGATSGRLPEWTKGRPWSGQTVFTFDTDAGVSPPEKPVPAAAFSACAEPSTSVASSDSTTAATPVSSETLCSVCETGASLLSCSCCIQKVDLCGACCLLRHAEGRYEVQKPNEDSERFEYVCRLKEPDVTESSTDEYVAPESLPLGQPDATLAFIGVFDGIGSARRALDLLGIKPALYLSIEIDA